MTLVLHHLNLIISYYFHKSLVMCKLIYNIILLFFYCIFFQLHSQTVFRNDSSYLIIQRDSAYFNVVSKSCKYDYDYDTMEYCIYQRTHADTSDWCHKLQDVRFVAGQGVFYIKDSVIYIKSSLNSNQLILFRIKECDNGGRMAVGPYFLTTNYKGLGIIDKIKLFFHYTKRLPYSNGLVTLFEI